MIRLALTICIIFAFQGCYEKKQPLPPFVLHPPKTTKSEIFEIGVAPTYFKAKLKALNDIASQLNTEIKSITLLKKSSQKKHSSFSKNITIITKQDIKNYKIIKEVFQNDKFFLLIKYEAESLKRKAESQAGWLRH